ncbi:MAG: chromate transporter [Chitinispirillaceae bacterium]
MTQKNARSRTAPSLVEIFLLFLRVGSVTLGGGLAMLSVLRHELLVRREWLRDEEFADELTGATSVPGAVVINFALFHGHRLRGIAGSVAALFGAVLPSFVIILIVAAFLFPYSDHPVATSFLRGASASVAGLLAHTALTMGRTMTRRASQLIVAFITAAVALLPWVHPIFALIGMGAVSFFLSGRNKGEKKGESGETS